MQTHCSTLLHTAPSCNSPQHTPAHFNTRYCNTWHQTTTPRNTLPHTTAYCNTMHHAAAAYSNTLHHIAIHCNTLPHTATHCNTLHHTETHCNTTHYAATHCSTPEAEKSGRRRCPLNRHLRQYSRFLMSELVLDACGPASLCLRFGCGIIWRKLRLSNLHYIFGVTSGQKTIYIPQKRLVFSKKRCTLHKRDVYCTKEPWIIWRNLRLDCWEDHIWCIRIYMERIKSAWNIIYCIDTIHTTYRI